MKTTRLRPTLKALRALHDQNVALVAERQELVRTVERLRMALEAEVTRTSVLHTERCISDERLAEVRTQLSDLRILLGLQNTIAVDTLKVLRNTLAEKVMR